MPVQSTYKAVSVLGAASGPRRSRDAEATTRMSRSAIPSTPRREGRTVRQRRRGPTRRQPDRHDPRHHQRLRRPQHHPADRRRHGRFGNHPRPELRKGRRRLLRRHRRPPADGSYTTYALTKDGKPDYVTDSAASASGWSTGTKTYNGALGINIKGDPQKTILELAKDHGFATGDITTSEIQDATPAALFAHITERDCYGPEEMARRLPGRNAREGRPGLGHRAAAGQPAPDVTMGGGAETFAQTATGGEYKGKTLEVQAKERGFQIVRTADELANASPRPTRTLRCSGCSPTATCR